MPVFNYFVYMPKSKITWLYGKCVFNFLRNQNLFLLKDFRSEKGPNNNLGFKILFLLLRRL